MSLNVKSVWTGTVSTTETVIYLGIVGLMFFGTVTVIAAWNVYEEWKAGRWRDDDAR